MRELRFPTKLVLSQTVYDLLLAALAPLADFAVSEYDNGIELHFYHDLSDAEMNTVRAAFQNVVDQFYPSEAAARQQVRADLQQLTKGTVQTALDQIEADLGRLSDANVAELKEILVGVLQRQAHMIRGLRHLAASDDTD